MDASNTEFVVLGKLLDPYGIKGWVRIHPFGDDPLKWGEMPKWWLGKEGGPWREVGLKRLRSQGDGLVAALEGVDSRNDAEALKGLLVAAPREALPETSNDEFYWADLIGLRVVNTVGEPLGLVKGLIETGASDVLVVSSEGGQERLLPFVSHVVLSVNREDACIQVDWGADW